MCQKATVIFSLRSKSASNAFSRLIFISICFWNIFIISSIVHSFCWNFLLCVIVPFSTQSVVNVYGRLAQCAFCFLNYSTLLKFTPCHVVGDSLSVIMSCCCCRRRFYYYDLFEKPYWGHIFCKKNCWAYIWLHQAWIHANHTDRVVHVNRQCLDKTNFIANF